jgi:hypothetical protein
MSKPVEYSLHLAQPTGAQVQEETCSDSGGVAEPVKPLKAKRYERLMILTVIQIDFVEWIDGQKIAENLVVWIAWVCGTL